MAISNDDARRNGNQRPEPVVASADKLTAKTLTARGGDTAAVQGSKNYNVGNLVYPEATSGAADLQHYVAFFINIRGASKYYKNQRVAEVTAAGQNRADRTSMGQSANVVGGAAGAFAGAKLGSTIGSKVAGNVGQTSTRTKNIAVLGAGAIGGIAGAAAATLFSPDRTFRLSEVIMLAIQNAPKTRYSADYDSTDMGITAGLVSGGSSVGDVDKMQMAGEAARALMLQAAEIPAGVASAVGASFNPGNIAAAGTGTTPNPFREQLFKSVDNRTFTFDYKFLPRSEGEVTNVKTIINMFKFHMHPEVTAGGLFYIYPSEFNIAYYYNGVENPNINKISTCVLTDMSVDYGGSQGFHSFASGMPTEINMSLTFRELEVLTKERIAQGY